MRQLPISLPLFARPLQPGQTLHQRFCALLAMLMVACPAMTTLAQSPAALPARRAAPRTLLGNSAPTQEFDLSYVLADAAVVVVARPGQVLRSEAAQMYPVEVLQAQVMKEMGLDILEADQVVVSVTPPLQGPPNYTALVKFSEQAKYDLNKFTRHHKSADLDGTEYWQPQGSPMEPSIMRLQENSFLLTPDFSLRQLMDKDRLEDVSEMRVKAAAAAGGADLFAMVDIATLKPLIDMGMAQAELPPELQDLRRLPELISTVELKVNLSNEGISELVATANSPAAADEIEAMLDSIKQTVKQKVLAETQQQLNSSDPVEQATGRYAQRMTKQIDEQLQIEREGPRMILFRHDPAAPGASSLLANYATIGMLVGLLLPAVQAAREAARRNMSMNNLKQIQLALLNWESARGELPAHAIYSEDGKPLLSWRVQILPYMENGNNLYERFHLDEPWDSEHNKQLIPLMPKVYAEPSSRHAPEAGLTQYLAPVGEGMIMTGDDNGMSIRQISDGMSNTISVLQVSDLTAAEWTKPADFQPNAKDPRQGLIAGPHPGGFLAAFADGHIEYISNGIDPVTFKAMLTRDGGEVINR